ncbi:MAG: O-antigen ligase family protein [Mycobacteriales bacterium]
MTDAGDRLAGSRLAAAFFVLLALTPNVPYIQLPIGLALNDFPPILAVICGMLAVAARHRRGELLPVTPIALMTSQIALIALASAVANGLVFKDFLGGPIRWFETTLIIAFAYILGSDRRLRMMFLRVALLAAAADAVFGIGAWVTAWEGPNYLGIQNFESYQVLYGVFPGRITGTLGLPSNGSGALFSLALPIAVGYTLGAKDRASRWRWLAVSGIFAVALVLTFSRVPLVLGVVAVVVLLAVRLKPSVAISAAVAFVLIVVASPLRARFQGDDNDRLRLWAAAVKMTRDNLFLGVGPTQYFVALPKYALSHWGLATNTAHNSVLEAAATMGIFAGLLLTAAIVASLAWLPVAMRLKRAQPEVLAAWLGLIGFVIASFTINYFFWPQLGILYWTMAIALSRWRHEPRTDAESPEQDRTVPVQKRRELVAGASKP